MTAQGGGSGDDTIDNTSPSSGGPTTGSSGDATSKVKGKRASTACTRCRRYRQKCIMPRINGKPQTPCESCVKKGKDFERECTVVPRGNSAQDRSFRRRNTGPSLGPTRTAKSKTTPRSSLPVNPSNSYASPVRIPSDRGAMSGASPQTHTSLAMMTSNESPSTAMTGDYLGPVVNDDGPQATSSNAHLLPPHAELVEGVRNFLYSYFQLGFLPRAFFLEQVESRPETVSVFLLLAILTLAARFSGGLIQRFGGRKEASAELRRRALSLLGEEMIQASVERMQGLFLLGVSEFGEGNGGRSWLLTGIAIRMAATLQLHREASYALDLNASPEDRIRSECARRSFWLVYCHDQQIAGRSPSTTFPLGSIDVRLPAEEDDFIFGHEPIHRSCLPGTMGLPDYHSEVGRSLFATMIIGQSLWARTAELACRPTNAKPWEEGEFTQLDRELRSWEENMPPRHIYSDFTLRVMKSQHLDLGYVSISMLLRLSHIVLRRAYLPTMITCLDQHKGANRASETPNDPPGGSFGFWTQMSSRMVQDCVGLHRIIVSCLATRPAMEGFPAVFIFGVYMCGDIAYHLCRWPELSLEHSGDGPKILQTAIATLELLEEAWPLATRWKTTLEQLVGHNVARSDPRRDSQMSLDGRNHSNLSFPLASVLDTIPTTNDSTSSAPGLAALSRIAASHPTIDPMLTLSQTPGAVPDLQDSQPRTGEMDGEGSTGSGSNGNGNEEFDFGSLVPGGDDLDPMSMDYFPADLTAFLRGEPVD